MGLWKRQWCLESMMHRSMQLMHRVNARRPGRAAGADSATVLAKDPFPPSCPVEGWSLWLALLSLRYLAAPALLQEQFWCSMFPKETKKMPLHILACLFSGDFRAVVKDSEQGIDCAWRPGPPVSLARHL